MGGIGSATARRLWARRDVRRFAFLAGLVLELALVGFTLGWTLTPSGDTAKSHSHASPAGLHVTVPQHDD